MPAHEIVKSRILCINANLSALSTHIQYLGEFNFKFKNGGEYLELWSFNCIYLENKKFTSYYEVKDLRKGVLRISYLVKISKFLQLRVIFSRIIILAQN